LVNDIPASRFNSEGSLGLLNAAKTLLLCLPRITQAYSSQSISDI
jgi:hypothetical protein